MVKFRIGLVGLALVFSLMLSGCWDQRELNDLAIVSGVGIDLTAEGKYQVSVQIVKPSAIKSDKDQKSGGSGQAVWVASAEGYTPFEAIRYLNTVAARKPYFAHSSVVVLGREVAESGVIPALDFLYRDGEPRLSQWLVVTPGKAVAVLRSEDGLEKISAMGLEEIVREYGFFSQSLRIDLNDFATRLRSRTTAPIATHIEVYEDQGTQRARIIGIAIFKRDRLVGTLDKAETRGLLWVLGQVESGIMVVNHPDGRVDLEIMRAQGRIVPEVRNGVPQITVEVAVFSNLAGDSYVGGIATPELLATLDRKQAAIVRNEILAAVVKAQELNVDIFGLGEAIYRRYPREWSKLEPQWETLFPQLPIEIEVKSQVRYIGLTTQKLGPA